MRFYDIKKVCPICGKEFVINCKHVWAYKIKQYKNKSKNPKIQYFCSYSCKNEYERRNNNETKESN